MSKEYQGTERRKAEVPVPMERRDNQSTLFDHARRIGAVEAFIDEIRGQNSKLFAMAENNLEVVSRMEETINNGIKKKIEDLCDTMREEKKNITQQITNNNEFNKTKFGEMEKSILSLQSRDMKINREIAELREEEKSTPSGFLNASFSDFKCILKNNKWVLWPILFFVIYNSLNINRATEIIKFLKGG